MTTSTAAIKPSRLTNPEYQALAEASDAARIAEADAWREIGDAFKMTAVYESAVLALRYVETPELRAFVTAFEERQRTGNARGAWVDAHPEYR